MFRIPCRTGNYENLSKTFICKYCLISSQCKVLRPEGYLSADHRLRIREGCRNDMKYWKKHDQYNDRHNHIQQNCKNLPSGLSILNLLKRSFDFTCVLLIRFSLLYHRLVSVTVLQILFTITRRIKLTRDWNRPAAVENEKSPLVRPTL